MKIKITTDSTADVSKEFLESYGISYIPLIVNLGDEEKLDTINVTVQDIAKFVDKTGKLPKTAARSSEDFKVFFKQFLDDINAFFHAFKSLGVQQMKIIFCCRTMQRYNIGFFI